jgi:guanylate kinase
MPVPPSPKNLILIISGPAGSGKTTLCDQLLEEFPDSISRIVTTTSRAPRPEEVDGVHYHFLPPDVFEQKLQAGEFIEWATVHGRYYGSQKAHLREILASGKDILFNIDVQGARNFKKLEKEGTELEGRLHCVFIHPESLQQLTERLEGRGDDAGEIERRLQTASEELQQVDAFDHVITSGTRTEDYAALRELYLRLREFPG